MANKQIMMGVVLTVAAVLCSGALAQSSCTNVLISMSPCLNYITGNSSNPSSQCCGQLASVVRSSPECLCQALNGGGSSIGVNVNQTQAMALPNACNVQTPPVSSCNAASPADSPAESPNTSGNGSKTIPSTEGDGSSDGTSISLSFSLLTFLFAAYHTSVMAH